MPEFVCGSFEIPTHAHRKLSWHVKVEIGMTDSCRPMPCISWRGWTCVRVMCSDAYQARSFILGWGCKDKVDSPNRGVILLFHMNSGNSSHVCLTEQTLDVQG